eukprot:gene15068-6233_t
MATRRTRANQASATINLDDPNDDALTTSSNTETIVHVESNDEETSSLSSQDDKYQCDPEKFASKLNKLEDKSARYQSHTEFLNECIDEKLVPNSLKIEVEPSIGNHDEAFLAMWNEKLKSYSIDLMKEIVKFCGITLSKTEQEKSKVDAPLNGEMDTDTYNDVKDQRKYTIKDSTINANTLQTKKDIPKGKVK